MFSVLSTKTSVRQWKPTFATFQTFEFAIKLPKSNVWQRSGPPSNSNARSLRKWQRHSTIENELFNNSGKMDSFVCLISIFYCYLKVFVYERKWKCKYANHRREFVNQGSMFSLFSLLYVKSICKRLLNSSLVNWLKQRTFFLTNRDGQIFVFTTNFVCVTSLSCDVFCHTQLCHTLCDKNEDVLTMDFCSQKAF